MEKTLQLFNELWMEQNNYLVCKGGTHTRILYKKIDGHITTTTWNYTTKDSWSYNVAKCRKENIDRIYNYICSTFYSLLWPLLLRRDILFEAACKNSERYWFDPYRGHIDGRIKEQKHIEDTCPLWKQPREYYFFNYCQCYRLSYNNKIIGIYAPTELELWVSNTHNNFIKYLSENIIDTSNYIPYPAENDDYKAFIENIDMVNILDRNLLLIFNNMETLVEGNLFD